MPFAFLAATQLLAVGVFLGLAGAALLRSKDAGRVAAGVVVVGALAVAVADAYSGAQLRPSANDAVVAVQAAGLLLVVLGTALRGRVPRPERVPTVLVAVGVVAAAAALGFAGSSRTGTAAALALLSLRAFGALLVLAALVAVARASVLAKVVAAIGVGLLVMAIASAAVVGTVVSDQLGTDQGRQLRQAAQGAGIDLASDTDTAVQLARLVAACPAAQLLTCARGIAVIAPTDAFAVVVDPAGRATFAGGTDALDPSLLAALVASDAVRDARNPVPGHPYEGSGFVLLRGGTTQLVALGVESVTDGTGTSVVAYGEQVGPRLMRQTRQRSTFDATVLALPDGRPLASSLSPAQAGQLAATARPLLTRVTSSQTAVSRIGRGSSPAAAFVLLPSGTQRVAVLALSGSSASVLRSQRTLLTLLFLALLVIGGLVAAAAVVLGRRAVEPVRRLTAAARAVGGGDLSVRPQATSGDEVGELARVFASMTGSLESLTGDLRRTAETEAATRARLGTVLDAISDALVVTGADGRVDLQNPAATDLLGDVLGRPAEDVLVDVGGGALATGEATLAAATGPVPVAVARAALPGGRGAVYALRDVTAARQLERSKTEFLSNVSHELRTPLTPVQGYADMLRRRPDLPPEKVQEMAESIAAGARRLARVVGLLVDVAALDAGKVRPAPVALPPAAVLDARLEEWRRRAPDRQLRRRVSAGTPDVLADPDLLARAVDELVDNALSHGDGPVTLLARRSGDGRVEIAVRDAGAGLDLAAHDALFADFEQVDASATRSHEGLGLGLAFVRRVCGLLDATVTVTSKPGAGATFALDLPAAAPPVRRRRQAGKRMTV